MKAYFFYSFFIIYQEVVYCFYPPYCYRETCCRAVVVMNMGRDVLRSKPSCYILWVPNFRVSLVSSINDIGEFGSMTF